MCSKGGRNYKFSIAHHICWRKDRWWAAVEVSGSLPGSDTRRVHGFNVFLLWRMFFDVHVRFVFVG